MCSLVPSPPPFLPSIHDNRQKWYYCEHKWKDAKVLKWVALSAGHSLWVSESTAGPSCACITWLEVVLLSHAYVLGDRNVTDFIISRCLPMVTLMIIFGSISATTTIVTQANECSCWCLPVFGNVVPYAFPKDRVGVCMYQAKLSNYCSKLT